MKVLVTGSKGMLGVDLTAQLQKEGHNVIGTDIDSLDICDLDAVTRTIKENKPDIIINCAGYTDVDKCETEVYNAYKVNSTGSENLAIASNQFDIPLVCIGSDYIFDGETNKPYIEGDMVNPLNVYGKSKLLGEENVKKHTKKYFILRTQWLYGKHGKNFVKSILTQAEKSGVLTVVNDQFGSPTYTKDLADTICEIIKTSSYGTYHVTNSGICSWYEFTKYIMKLAKINIEVKPCTSEEFPRPAKRPRYSPLDNLNLRLCNFKALRHYEDALREYLDEIQYSKNQDNNMRSMKKVLVTGAGGYIGRHVVQKLLEYDVQVIATDLYVDEIDKRAQIIKADILGELENPFEYFGSPDVCVHMAWRNGFVHNSDTHIGDLSGHFNFLHKMINSGLKQLAVMGTMHEVGYYEGAIDENTPCNPVSMYGISKDALRRSSQLLVNGKNIIFQWLRGFYIYGDDKKNNSIFAKLFLAAEEGKIEFPFTTGKNLYDFIHVDELAKQIVACAVQSEIAGIINCCTGKPVSLAEKVEGFIKEHSLNIKLVYGAYPDRQYDSPGIWGNNEKIVMVMNNNKLLVK
jgi:dTDP-4-dehydrorhamnose reductase